MTVQLQRQALFEGRMPPLSWRPLKTEGKWTASVTCANGHAGTLDDHEIAPDGTVSPSAVCPWTGCDFHEMVQLQGWAEFIRSVAP